MYAELLIQYIRVVILVYDDIKENIESLIEEAIAIRNKYPK